MPAVSRDDAHSGGPDCSACGLRLSASRSGSIPPRPMGRHVLIVDDDYESREALREMLRMWGHEVDVAADGCEAVRLALERRPEVVLLDLGLPDLNGQEVARR